MFFQQVRTGDLGGYATSDEFTRAVIANLDVWALFAKLLRCIYAQAMHMEPFYERLTFFIWEGSKCRFPYVSGNIFLNYNLFTHTYPYCFLIYETYIMYYV